MATNNRKRLSKMTGNITLGEQLRFARELAEMTQTDLGSKFGKSRQNISDIENMRKPISYETVVNYALHTGYNINFLVERFFEHKIKSDQRVKIKGTIKILTKDQLKKIA